MSRAPVKTVVFSLKLTPDQLRLFEERSGRCKMSVSAWMRTILGQAATRPANNGYIRVREPDGATT